MSSSGMDLISLSLFFEIVMIFAPLSFVGLSGGDDADHTRSVGVHDNYQDVVTNGADVDKAVFTVIFALVGGSQHGAGPGEDLLRFTEADPVLFPVFPFLFLSQAKRSAKLPPTEYNYDCSYCFEIFNLALRGNG